MSQGTGRLPDGWAEVTIGDVTAAKVAQTGPVGTAEFKYIDISSVDNRKKRITEPKLLPVTDAPSRARQVVHRGDVLVSMTRPNLNAVAVVPEALDGTVASTGFHVLRSTGVEAEWLFAVVRSAAFVERMSELVQGALYPAVRASDIRDFSFPLPPRLEQRRILARLMELQLSTRRAREALEQVPALVERFRQSVLASAFRGDLTAEWRERHPDVEPASVLLERIRAERRRRWEEAELEKMRAKGKEPRDDRWKAKYTEPEPVDATKLPELPAGWAWAAAEDLVAAGRPIIYGIIKPGPEFPGGVPYVRVTEMKNGRIDVAALPRCAPERAKKFARATLLAGDVLVSKDGTIGKVAIVPPDLEGGNITQHVLRVSPAAGILPEYIARAIEAPLSQNWMHGELKGIGLQGVNVGDFRRMPIPVAPASEQAVLCRVVGAALESLRVQNTACARAGDAIAVLDQAVLAKAFRGELVPQDPNDEPASMLLERIRGERAARPRAGRRGA